MFLIAGIIMALVVFITLQVLSLRRVVSTNEVHIVQKASKTLSYGKDTTDNVGNVYYEFPSWLPVIGITKTILPVSNFDLDIENYEAYDKDRLPFVVDIKAFFRIADSNKAACRVLNFAELKQQLEGIVKGAIRSILAKEDLENIMSERNIYGDKFTSEINTQLAEWGVQPVKNIELMDIRDSKGSDVIVNIMAKKKSQIEMESRVTVASNMQKAKEAEILATQEVALKEQNAEKEVGLRRVQVSQEVGIAQQQTEQKIQEEVKNTTEKAMDALKVSEVRKAEINKQATIVNAEAEKEKKVINAEAEKAQLVLRAEANLITVTKNAEGIELEGKAKAEAEKAIQLAPVEAQIKLAEEIGENGAYQNYLITLEKIKATAEVGIEQAKNLSKADIKIFANSGDISEGVTKASSIFSAKGGLDVASMLESLSSTPVGKAISEKILNNTDNK